MPHPRKIRPALFRPTARRLRVESLEDRLAPAIFTGAGPDMAIELNNPNEVATLSTNGTTVTVTLNNGTANTAATGGHVTGNGTATATFASATYNGTIFIEDTAAGTAVAFANSTGAYLSQFNVTLNDPASGNITFAGTSTFAQTVTAVTSAGFVASDAGSSVTLAPAPASLVVNAVGHDILFAGALVVAGQTTLVGNVIQADNPANDFGGPLAVSSPVVASVFDLNDLTLSTSSLAFGGLGQTTRITANGNITQAGPLTVTAGTLAALAVTSTGGSITLTNAGNNISTDVALALAVTGANTETVVNTTGLLLGDVTLGTGALTLTFNGTLTQRFGTTIQTDGPVALTVSTGLNRNITLGNAGNRIAGAITIAETAGGDVRDVTIRNAFDTALPPTGTPLTTAGDVRNLTLFFDNNGVALPGYNISGNLTVTAGGDVTQTAALTVAGTTTVTILGDFGIDLSNSANAFTGIVSLNDTRSTRPVRVAAGGVLGLAACDLGRGTFDATAGQVTSGNAITQRKGAGAATFTNTVFPSINLTGPNDFPGRVNFVGPLTVVNVRNADFQANVADLTGTLPASVNDLTLTLDNAAAVLPSFTLTNLFVTALGIVQQPGSALTLSGAGTFSASTFAVNLSNPGNDFTNLRLNNSGRNDVTVVDADDIAFTGTSQLGTGRLTVTAGGNITEPGTITQDASGPAGDVRFTSTGSIGLTGNNQFRGPVSLTVGGANPATVSDPNATLTLGTVTTGTGAFTATGQGIVQDPNSVLSLGGPSAFTVAGVNPATLANRTNTFGGPVALNAFNATVRATGSVVLAASAVLGSLSVKTGGAAKDSVTQTGAVIGGSSAAFDAGAGGVVLTDAGNDFGSVSVTSTGATVSIRDTNALTVGPIRVGGGTLTLTTGGDLGTAAGGSVVQTAGAGAITLTTPAASNVTLGSTVNAWRGPVTVTSAANVTLQNQGDVAFTPASVVTGNLVVTAGGTLTLPATVNVGGLFLSAASMTIANDITAGAGVVIRGTVNFIGNRTVNATTFGVNIIGDVNAGGTLTFNIGNAEGVILHDGTWNQGANNLTVNGPTTFLVVGDLMNNPARLVMTGGMITIANSGQLSVTGDGTLQVGTDPAVSETVTVANGGGQIFFGGSLAVGLGATPDRLVKTGTGPILLGANLVGTGLAAATGAPVLAAEAYVAGRFAHSVNAQGNAQDFFAGSDIVTPTYFPDRVEVKAGGVAAPTGTAVGTLADGDRYSVKSSLGAAAGLVTVEDPSGNLNVVVRNATAAAASTLTFAALGGGDGQLSVGGVAVHTPGSVTVLAPAANFGGDFTTAGTLTALTARDLGVARPFTLTGGGPTTGATSLTARVLDDASVTVPGPLKTLKAVSVGNQFSDATLSARSFGTLTTTGLAAANDPGDFNATLTSTTPATGPVVMSATFAGTLSGTWDLRGSVGTVKTSGASSWTLGTAAGSNVRNGGLFTGATALTLGRVVDMRLRATGAVAALTASDVSASALTAGSWGTVKVTGNPALGLLGDFNSSALTATGNAAGVGIKALTIAGDLTASAVNLQNGDATAITVGRTINNSTITAADTGTRGALKAVTAAGLSLATIDARSIGTLTVKPNLAANLFGDVFGSTVTARGNALGVGLGTFAAAGSVFGSPFDVQSGNLTKFAVARVLSNTTVRLPDPAFGALGTIQAGRWLGGVGVLAETIGTVASVGAPAALPNSPLLVGGIDSAAITAYQDAGTAPAIGKLTAKGDFSSSTLTAERGIGTVAVGRTVANSFLIADDAQAGAPAVGLVKTLTAGAWTTSTAAANTFGTVKVTAYAQPENATANFVFGDVTTGTLTAAGGGAGVPGIATLSVAGSVLGGLIKAPFGIKALTAGGILASPKVVTDNPADPAAGTLAAVTVGGMNGATVRAGGIGTLNVTANPAVNSSGTVSGSTIAVNSAAATRTGPQAVGSLTVAGDWTDSALDAPAAVGAIAVGGRVAPSSGGTRIQAGYDTGAKLGTLTAGAWGSPFGSQTTDLVTRAVGTFALKGNAARGFAGTADRAFVDVLGNAAGVGLGTFTATGSVADSLFRVSDGDVGSFTVQRFLSSDVLVGFRPVKGSDVTRDPAAANWSATDHTLGAFNTTAVFDPADPASSASFADSNVVAAILGSLTLSGVDPTDSEATAFGVGFRTGAGAAAKGTVKRGGATLAPGAADGQFHYLGLPG